MILCFSCSCRVTLAAHQSEHHNPGTTHTRHLLSSWNTCHTQTSWGFCHLFLDADNCSEGALHMFTCNYLLISACWHAALVFSHCGQHLYNTAWCSCTFPLWKCKNKSNLMVQFKPETFYVFLTSINAPKQETHSQTRRGTHILVLPFGEDFHQLVVWQRPWPWL